MAELVDAADSKSAVRKDVLVRFQSRALNKTSSFDGVLLFNTAFNDNSLKVTFNFKNLNEE